MLVTLGAAMGLDAGLFAQPTAVSWATAGWIALLAGVSSVFGHLAVLTLNRIGGVHLVMSLVLNSALLAGLYVVQAAVIWCVGSLVLTRPLPLHGLGVVALLSLSPQVFAVVTALPHFGLGVGRVLEGWSHVILWFGVAHVFRLGWALALAITITGWLVMQLLSRLLHRPTSWMLSRLWSLATGRPTMVTARDILAGTPMIPVGQHREAREATR